MTNYRKIFSYICMGFLSTLLLTGCLDRGTSDQPMYYEINGVVEKDGEPVAGADIHFRNYFEPGGFRQQPFSDSTVTVYADVPVPDVYTAQLYRYQGTEPLKTIYDDSLDVGEHFIPINDEWLSNGFFVYTIENSLSQGFTGIFIVNKPDTALPGILPFAKTKMDGSFSLNPAPMAFGRTFTTSEDGSRIEITDSLQIIITRGDSILTKENVWVEPDVQNNFEINID